MKSESPPPRKTSARNPSHFGSKRRSPVAGIDSAIFASMGSIGGFSTTVGQRFGDFARRGAPRRLPPMTATVAAIFFLVYVGMILGGLPFLQLDRTGVALLGAIAIVGLGALTPEQAALSIHLPTLLLLFSFMVLSAQMRLGGFYTWVTLRIAALPLAPPALLAATMAAVAALSAVFSNDVVCLAVAPVLADACARRRLDPVPYLIGLACAANIGSAATLIGNPQNMLIGQVLEMHFAAYLRVAIVPTLLGLAAAWGIIAWQLP